MAAASRANPEWRHEFQDTLPDLCDDDIPGSGFAITGYTVHEKLGGNAALARLRERMKKRGLRLLLDFVPNHMGPDHPWVEEHPEYFVPGTELDLARAPKNYTWVRRKKGDKLLALGRDPYFAGWPDTLQLNYGNPATQEAMTKELLKIAGQCDAVRCDMAMLVLPNVFERTWGIRSEPFWPKATKTVKDRFPDFRFMAEVYWDLEWELQHQGFDYTYDKRLYDRLREGHAQPVRDHLRADMGYQNKMARFLENHDEPRAAATFPHGQHEAAAVITFLAPGLRFFHQGQFEGRKKRISPHLCRAPEEPVDARLQAFYGDLLRALKRPVVREGEWRLLDCVPAWDGNWTNDCFLAFAWKRGDERLLAVVNYAPNRSQCYVRLPFADLGARQWRLDDLLSDASYVREGNDLQGKGLYLDESGWKTSIFQMTDLALFKGDGFQVEMTVPMEKAAPKTRKAKALT
ncbi:MAG: alpha-amylase family glycosyl hydrolase [Gemmataceae bacterium]